MSPKSGWDPRRRPPQHLLQKTPVYRYPLEDEAEVVLLQQLELYNGRIYWFCLTLALVENDEDQHIERVDTCHLEVHRHRFSSSGGGDERIHICTFEAGDNMLLETEHDRAYEDYLVTWPQRVEQWKGR